MASWPWTCILLETERTGFTLVRQERGGAMDRPVGGGFDGSLLVDGLTNDIQDTTKGTRADRHLDGVPLILHLLATDQTFSSIHGNRTHNTLTNVLSDFQYQTRLSLLDLHFQSIQDPGELVIELEYKEKE